MADKLASLKRSAAEKKGRDQEMRAEPESRDDFPYGTRLNLDHDTLEKMGLHEGPLPKAGAKFTLAGRGHISDASESTDGQGKTTRRLELQLTHARVDHDGDKDTDGDKDEKGKPGEGVRADLEKAFSASSAKTDARNAASNGKGKPALP